MKKALHSIKIIAFYKNHCYNLSEQRRSWSFGSRLEFPNESRFALPNRLVEPKNKEPYKRCSNAPDSYIRSIFFAKTGGIIMDDLLQK